MNMRYRVNWRGKLVLQVFDYSFFHHEYKWRDATVEDITEGTVV